MRQSQPPYRPVLYLMVGIQGSGKTTFARRYFPDALRISLDDIRMMLSGKSFRQDFEKPVSAIGNSALRAALSGAQSWRQSVVFDATNISPDWRRRGLEQVSEYGARSVAIFIDCPLALAKTRNSARPNPVPDAVIERFHALLVPPSLDEGFAEVRVFHSSGF